MKTKLLWLALFLSISLLAQEPSMKWGRISDVEWGMEVCAFDSTASAVILMENESIFFSDGRAYFEVHRRIKILDEKGFEYANLEIPYYHYDNNEWVSKFKGATYIKDEKGKVKKIKVKDTYDDKINKYSSQFKVAFPAIKKGVIIEYKYQFSTQNLLSLEPWEFQHEIPTVYSRVGVETPEWLRYQVISFGRDFNKKYDNTIARKEWILEKQPGYKDEDFTYNSKDYINKILFQVDSYLSAAGWESVIKDWAELGKDKKKAYQEIFKKAEKNKHLLDGVLSDSDTKAQKVEKIVHFMRKTYTWNGFYSTQVSKKFDKLLKDKKSDVADLNLWMIGLMRAVGLQADPVLISTKSHGKPIVSYPVVTQFNAIICSVQVNGKPVLVDAVERGRKLPYDLLPKEDLNYIGLKLGKDKTEWIDIPFDNRSRTQMLIDFDFDSGTAEMNGRFMRYVASEKRQLLSKGNHFFDNKLLQGMAGQEIEFEKPVIKNEDNPESPLSFTNTIKMEELPGDELLYFIPALWTGLEEAPFKKAERTLPVELPYPFSKQIVLKLNYPKGYELSEVPEDLSLELPSDLGSFTYGIQKEEGGCRLSIRLQMKEVYMTPPSYFSLKEFYEIISEKVNEALIFRKP